MSYYETLGLTREPFSTSPDPAFFFQSKEHKAAFCRLQITITLKRGLSVILGDVGTGKTTLSRKLSRVLRDDPDVLFFMILNPYFKTEKQFLAKLAALFHIDISPRATGLQTIEAIERFLFTQGVEKNRTVVLLIDEAQILPDFVFETLRILLNYETNEYKILQLVLVGQMELLPRIRSMSNFWDRIALRYVLNPLGEEEVREMVDFRLRQAGYRGAAPLFTDSAIQRVWEHTQGYPRRLSLTCHNALEALVMYDRKLVDDDVIEKVIEHENRATGGAEVTAADLEPVALLSDLRPPTSELEHQPVIQPHRDETPPPCADRVSRPDRTPGQPAPGPQAPCPVGSFVNRLNAALKILRGR